jgi:cytochrome c-type biogenesis protein CcmE
LLKRKKFLIGGIIILIAIGSLAFKFIGDAAVYYYSVSDALSKESTLQGQTIRIAGQVAPGSISRDTSTGILQFRLVDLSNSAKVVAVSYKGDVPDIFKEGSDAVVEGQLSSASAFAGTQIIGKCPSKYVPKQ